MGQELFCDVCGRVQPTLAALHKVIIGSESLGEICINCAIAIKTELRKQIQTALKARNTPAPAAPVEQSIPSTSMGA